MLKLAKYARYAKSITVKAPDAGVNSVRLTAVYKGNLCDDEEVHVALNQNGQSHTFQEKTEYMGAQHWGTWTSTRPIHILKGTIVTGTEERNFEIKPMDFCNEVVPNLSFSLHPEQSHVQVNNPSRKILFNA